MLIEAFRSHMVLAGFRPSTITAKLTCLKAFDVFASPRGLEYANRFDVESYLARDLSPESRRAYRSHLRGFYQWACEEGFVADDPTAGLPTIRVPQAAPRPISEADLGKAMRSANARMLAWLLLMALAGLRCVEVAALRPEDIIQTESGALLFLRECKGGGTAMQPCHPAVLAALLRLPIRDGLWWSVSRTTISAQVSQYLHSVGVNATAHQLRHFAGTAWYQASGHDLLTTARLLRHQHVNTSQIYAQLDPTRPAEVVNLVQPPATQRTRPSPKAEAGPAEPGRGGPAA